MRQRSIQEVSVAWVCMVVLLRGQTRSMSVRYSADAMTSTTDAPCGTYSHVTRKMMTASMDITSNDLISRETGRDDLHSNQLVM